ncbi:MAG: molecular chaperone DnaJ [Mycoplasmataceae bacterium RV_VA103A]|nr:MAG: molecular chaperone DnaJ [Mycoplasmataceae bacterium RV_VA103A]
MEKSYWEILGVARGASESEIKSAYRNLSRQWHPDRWANKSEREKKKAEAKMMEINEAHSFLSDEKKRRLYEQHGDNWQAHYHEEAPKYFCSECSKEIKEDKVEMPGIKDKFFCSKKHGRKYWNDRFGKKENGPCRSCGSIHNENTTGVPERCELIINEISELENLSHWYFFTSSEKDEFIEEVKSSKHFFDPDEFNGHLKRTLKKAEMLNERKKNLIDQERNNFLQQLKNLAGWNLLGEERQNEIIEEMKRNKTTDQFSDVLEMTKKEIAKVKGGNENDTSLDAEIRKAISEIEVELNREPKITAQKQPNFNWKDYLKTAANPNELQSRKKEILDVIRAARRQKVLSEAIQKIKNALNQQPVIKNGELSNPNWENELNSLSEENQIIRLRDQILGEIKQKRAKKEIAGKLDELIRQAQTAITNNDLITLEKLLNQIETYQSDSAYEERKTDIERLFQQLAAVSLPKYRELTINSLDEFLRQDPPLSLDELEKANQNFAEQIKNASSAEEIKNIKNSVSNNINQGRSNKIVVNLINQAKQARTEEEKSAVRQKISELENSDNQWIKTALAAKKDELQKIVNSWVLGEIPNTNSPSSDNKEPNNYLPLTIFLVVVISGIAIIAGWLLFRRRKRQLY